MGSVEAMAGQDVALSAQLAGLVAQGCEGLAGEARGAGISHEMVHSNGLSIIVHVGSKRCNSGH